MTNNKPIYSFLGFLMTEANIVHQTSNQIEKMNMKLINSSFDTNEREYRIIIDVSFNYVDEKESKLRFISAFVINSQKWIENNDNKLINQLFVSTAFPFIRSKVFEITGDSRMGFMFPTIDLRNVDMEQGITLELKTSAKKKSI